MQVLENVPKLHIYNTIQHLPQNCEFTPELQIYSKTAHLPQNCTFTPKFNILQNLNQFNPKIEEWDLTDVSTSLYL